MSVGGNSALNAFTNVATATTDGPLVTAVPGQRIRVLGIAMLTGGVATTITFNTKPAGAGTAISCLFALPISGGMVMSDAAGGWFRTNVGEGLTVTSGAGSTTGIQVVFDLVS